MFMFSAEEVRLAHEDRVEELRKDYALAQRRGHRINEVVRQSRKWGLKLLKRDKV